MIGHPTHTIDGFAGMLDTSLLNDMAQAEAMTISKLMVGTCPTSQPLVRKHRSAVVAPTIR